jgi:hypothetical protein
MSKELDNSTSKKGWQEIFLATLALSPNVSKAARSAGIDRSRAYQLRQLDADFAQRWDDVIEESTDDLEDTARSMAKGGDTTMVIFLLKAHRPEKYREKFSTEITGKDGGPIDLTDARAALLRGIIPEAPGG